MTKPTCPDCGSPEVVIYKEGQTFIECYLCGYKAPYQQPEEEEQQEDDK